MKLEQWTITELAALGAGSIEGLSKRRPLCWSADQIKALWRALGKPRRFTAKQVLDRCQGQVQDRALFRLLCVMLPARVINPWLGCTGRKRDEYDMPWDEDVPAALEKLAEILDGY